MSPESPDPAPAELWHEVVSRAFVPLDVRFLPAAPSPGRIVTRQLGPVQVSRVEAGPQAVTRNRRLIARNGDDFLILSLQQRGAALKDQDGRQSRIGPGEWSLSDPSRPFRRELRCPFRFLSFQFSRADLRVRDGDLRAVTATAFARTDGCHRLVASYLSRLGRSAAELEGPVGHQLGRTALNLLAMLIDERCGRFAPQAPDRAAALLVRVMDRIVRHLGDPELSPAAIAAAHFISVRYLHVLFRAEELSVGGRIRAERLRRCRQELLEPAAARDGVAAVARRWGFVSPSHFSRALREEYGQSPRDWQKWASERNASAAA